MLDNARIAAPQSIWLPELESSRASTASSSAVTLAASPSLMSIRVRCMHIVPVSLPFPARPEARLVRRGWQKVTSLE